MSIPFARTKTDYRLIWTAPDGELAGAYFDTWEELEKFSKTCIKKGLTPYVPADCKTPYDRKVS